MITAAAKTVLQRRVAAILLDKEITTRPELAHQHHQGCSENPTHCARDMGEALDLERALRVIEAIAAHEDTHTCLSDEHAARVLGSTAGRR